MNSYYNTSNVTEPILSQYQAKAETQEQIIRRIFRHNTTGLTAVEVMYKFPSKRTPLTSIRRALSNLVADGYLLKTTRQREGLFGRDNYIYIKNTGQLLLF